MNNHKAERRQLLKQLGVYELTNCAACPRKAILNEARQNSTVHPDRDCGGCETYKEIRKIGERLSGLHITEMSIMNPPRFKGRKSQMETKVIKKYLDKFYDQLVAEGHSEKWICRHCCVSHTFLAGWKKKRKADGYGAEKETSNCKFGKGL